MVQFGQLRNQWSPDSPNQPNGTTLVPFILWSFNGQFRGWNRIFQNFNQKVFFLHVFTPWRIFLSASFCAWCFLEIPVERSLPVFYRMKPENISCEANVFPTENRGLFFNDTSDDILEDCVIVDKLGIDERTVIWPIRPGTLDWTFVDP